MDNNNAKTDRGGNRVGCWIVFAMVGGSIVLPLFLVVSGAFAIFVPNPPRPTITHGEFPISVIVEIDGEIHVIEDTIIAEFAGFTNRTTAGRFRVWESHLKSGNSSLTIFRIEERETIIEISIGYGRPEYYMGDFQWITREGQERLIADRRFNSYTRWENDVQTHAWISEDELYERFNLRIIEIRHGEPIENSFERRTWPW
jgi:hypothetical protein